MSKRNTYVGVNVDFQIKKNNMFVWQTIATIYYRIILVLLSDLFYGPDATDIGTQSKKLLGVPSKWIVSRTKTQ